MRLDFSGLKEYETMKPGLERIKAFLDCIGNPQDNFTTIQIAGTNGKGSTAAFLAAILSAHGYKTGLFTSPHLIDVTERVQADGLAVSKKIFEQIVNQNIDRARNLNLSYFEFLTAIGLIYFNMAGIDFAVMETGLGGRFDSTNICKSRACIITTISYDHQEILGETLSAIAYEKAGIIKGGESVFCGALPQEALKEIKKLSRPFVFGKDFTAQNINCEGEFYSFDFVGFNKTIEGLKLSLAGAHQVQNAALAISCAITLLGEKLDGQVLRQALSTTKWPARFDIKSFGGRTFIIDGCHNLEAFEAFIKTWKVLEFGKERRPFIFAMMRQKDFAPIIKMFAPIVSRIILPDISNPRALEFSVLSDEFKKYLPAADIIKA
ncbi:MAG: bifunctional folylpolyglutamate synthase/dihydrofolate synthase, partial [Elusimicrobiota bacterium]|nr:bifunctional folylpolyglutamate synthase/dihydrofolate synthase [Elusimicrobiota bacterium]